jgi:hypothetical protein
MKSLKRALAPLLIGAFFATALVASITRIGHATEDYEFSPMPVPSAIARRRVCQSGVVRSVEVTLPASKK